MVFFILSKYTLLTFHTLHSFLENLTPSWKLKCVSDLMLNLMMTLCLLGAEVKATNKFLQTSCLMYICLSSLHTSSFIQFLFSIDIVSTILDFSSIIMHRLFFLLTYILMCLLLRLFFLIFSVDLYPWFNTKMLLMFWWLKKRKYVPRRWHRGWNAQLWKHLLEYI